MERSDEMLSSNHHIDAAHCPLHQLQRESPRATMTPKSSTKSTMQKPLRVALLLAWRDKGFSRPRYGQVDDEELLRTGRSNFLCTDGRTLLVTRNDLLLLQRASDDHSTDSTISPPTRHPIPAQRSSAPIGVAAGE